MEDKKRLAYVKLLIHSILISTILFNPFVPSIEAQEGQSLNFSELDVFYICSSNQDSRGHGESPSKDVEVYFERVWGSGEEASTNLVIIGAAVVTGFDPIPDLEDKELLTASRVLTAFDSVREVKREDHLIPREVLWRQISNSNSVEDFAGSINNPKALGFNNGPGVYNAYRVKRQYDDPLSDLFSHRFHSEGLLVFPGEILNQNPDTFNARFHLKVEMMGTSDFTPPLADFSEADFFDLKCIVQRDHNQTRSTLTTTIMQRSASAHLENSANFEGSLERLQSQWDQLSDENRHLVGAEMSQWLIGAAGAAAAAGGASRWLRNTGYQSLVRGLQPVAKAFRALPWAGTVGFLGATAASVVSAESNALGCISPDPLVNLTNLHGAALNQCFQNRPLGFEEVRALTEILADIENVSP